MNVKEIMRNNFLLEYKLKLSQTRQFRTNFQTITDKKRIHFIYTDKIYK